MKNKLIKIFACVLVVALAISMLTACAPKEKQLTGYDVDLMNAVFEKLDVKCDTVEIDWNSKVMEIKSNKIDVIWNGMTITDELKAELAISNPYLTNKQVAVVKADKADNYVATADYADAAIAVESGSAGETLAKTLVDGASQISGVSKQTDALMAVYSGTSEVAILDATMAGFTIVNSDLYKGKLEIVELNDVEVEYYGIAFRSGSVLKAKVNWALAELYLDGTMTEIAEKYGLENEVVAMEKFTEPTYTDEQLSEWNELIKTQVTVGVTYFQPICYVVEG